jgi:hypothetical protein
VSELAEAVGVQATRAMAADIPLNITLTDWLVGMKSVGCIG